jgi:Flp pilus assembly protein TadB
METFLFGLIPLTAIVGGITYAIVKATSMARVRELEVRERIAMIEKGLIPPPESNPRGFERAMEVIDRVERHDPYDGPYRDRHRRGAERHRSAGITLMGVGFGLMFMIGIAAGAPGPGIGVGGFLVLLGLAFFINSRFDRHVERERPRFPDSMPPPNTPPPVIAHPDSPRHE